MTPAIRRLLSLLVVFVAAFAAVTALRTWRAGGDFRSLIPGLADSSGQFRPEAFTLPKEAPLAIGDVELLSRLNNEYARLTEAVVPSVVSIYTSQVREGEPLFDAWGGAAQARDYPPQGQGSGVIVTREGHVVTNHHVIAGQRSIKIVLHGGKSYSAQLVGEDELLDIAVLKIEADETFVPLKLGDSEKVRVGQIVMAVGNPFRLGETVTQGIISAKNRSVSDSQRDLFQTDAAINPGNSGGPLVNLQGEIIGINSSIYSPDKKNPGFQGVGFSIPSNDVKESLFQILERGRPIRGYLGVRAEELSPRVRAILNYPGPGGAVISLVSPSSPAETAGLLYADIVQRVNGEEIKSAYQLIAIVQRAKIGEELTLEIWRKGEVQSLKATIAESGMGQTKAGAQPPANDQGQTRDPVEILEAVGIQVRDLSVPERMQGLRGAVVTSIAAQSLAAGQLQPDDLIWAVNGIRIGSAGDFFQNLAASAAVQSTALTLNRQGQNLRLTLPPVPRQK